MQLKPFSIKPSALVMHSSLLFSSLFIGPLFSHALANTVDTDDIDVITVTHQRHQNLEDNIGVAIGKTSTVDLANWLMSVPGANINKNGPVTGIAQYRGLYGDRLSITLDNHPVIGAGPNAMDTPLSYSTPLIVDSMSVYRGVAPVAAGIDTIAGAIEVKMRKAELSNSNDWQTTGDIQTGYRSNTNAQTLSSVLNFGQKNIAVLAYGNVQSGDDYQTGDGRSIAPTEFQKRQFGGDIRYQTSDSEIGFRYHYTDTQDSGTPALPMDIEYIYTHRVALDGVFSVAGWEVDWTVGFTDADHGMTNFLMRFNNNLGKYRRNNAIAATTDFDIAMEQTFDFGELLLGIDGYFSEHDAIITNPNNAMFEVVNFNNVQDDRLSAYFQWQQSFEQFQVQLGARIKQVTANAGKVSTSMAMMGMPMGSSPMAQMAIILRDNFNQADRSVSDTLFDIALNIESELSDSVSMNMGLGIKSRAASYQARYLWTPMEATGGLADGNTYIGNINLEAETAYQSNLGLTYQANGISIAPQVFYQRIDDYIQGAPLGMMDMTARMMAQMMSGDDNPLKFTNVDAKLYGIDVNWYAQLTDTVSMSGIASYVEGKRRDINDNLYRIAPLNGRVNINYAADSWLASIEFVAAAKQDDVSTTNEEAVTAGYGLVNLTADYYVNQSMTLRAGIDNLLDKHYQQHLGAYNRVKNSEVMTMQRLPSEGMSAWFELSYSF